MTRVSNTLVEESPTGLVVTTATGPLGSRIDRIDLHPAGLHRTPTSQVAVLDREAARLVATGDVHEALEELRAGVIESGHLHDEGSPQHQERTHTGEMTGTGLQGGTQDKMTGLQGRLQGTADLLLA